VPLDPEYPRELLRFMMEDSGAAVILTQQRFQDLTAAYRRPVICLDTGWDAVAMEADDNLPSRVTADRLAYVIYTSGSTGRPKGAMNTHRGIANRLRWMQDTYRLTEHDRVLQKTPFSFDVSVWEFFWPLMTGAQLVVAKPGGHRDATYLVKLVEHSNITTLHFVPSMLQAFIDEPGVAACRALKRVVCSGEAITPELLRRYVSRVNVPCNLYGPPKPPST
jgi:microcystin synthetase protein McyA